MQAPPERSTATRSRWRSSRKPRAPNRRPSPQAGAARQRYRAVRCQACAAASRAGQVLRREAAALRVRVSPASRWSWRTGPSRRMPAGRIHPRRERARRHRTRAGTAPQNKPSGAVAAVAPFCAQASRSADTPVAITASSTAVCDQQTAEGASRRSRGAQHLGSATGRRPLPAGKVVDDYAQFAQTRQDSSSGIVNGCGPKSPDSHRAVWGLISRPPVSPAGFPPVSRLPAGFFPFVRLPLASLRPASSGSFPSAVARFRFPLGFPPGPLSLGQPSR